MKSDDDKTGIVERVLYYVPRRPPTLRDADMEPPPLPASPLQAPEHGFGAADEDGLRMLAALETLTSLEPDYSGDHDFAAEASVTIVDASGDEIVAMAFRAEPAHPFRRSPAYAEPGLLLNGYETFLGPGEEAVVEIVEITPVLDVTATTAAAEPTQIDSLPPTSLTQRLAAAAGPGGRFLKALSGD